MGGTFKRALSLAVILVGLAAACSPAVSERESAVSPARTEPAPNRPGPWSTSVPLQIINNKLLVPVVLNDRHSATMLLDTGANFTIISPDMARRAGLDATAVIGRTKVRLANGQDIETSVVHLQAISVGQAKIVNFSAAVYTFAIKDRAGQPLAIDGFLGLDFLAQYTMTVDPQAATLTLQVPGPR